MTDINPAEWVREQCIELSRWTKTGIDVWSSMTIVELGLWIGTFNRMEKRRREEERNGYR